MPGVIYELDDERVVAAPARSTPFRAVDATRSPDAVVSLNDGSAPVRSPARHALGGFDPRALGSNDYISAVVMAVVRRVARMPALPGDGSRMVSGALLTPGDVQGPRRRMDDGGGVGMPRVHQVQQRPQRPFRVALVGPHDDLGCEDVDP